MQGKIPYFLGFVIRAVTISEVPGSNLGVDKVKKFHFVWFIFASRFRQIKNLQILDDFSKIFYIRDIKINDAGGGQKLCTICTIQLIKNFLILSSIVLINFNFYILANFFGLALSIHRYKILSKRITIEIQRTPFGATPLSIFFAPPLSHMVWIKPP